VKNYSSRRTNWQRSLVAIAAGLCLAGAVFAAETGGLRISVTSADGKPVAGATVKISSPSSLVTKTAVTEADGTIRVTGLDPATDYKVEVVAGGYNGFTASNVAVVSGQNLSVGYALATAGSSTIVVTGSRLARLDTTSAVVGTTLTLDIVESLPTTRSYQGYLQLVPGVKPSTGGNPASKSGVNYADIGGATGTSTDNVYILDGVDVTDSNTGTFGSNINSEIIQEQRVLTGGIPAEYAGGSGLVSKVITKSGSDEFHGSINYYLQNDSLVAKNKHNTDSGFSTYDTAITLGGPIVKGKLWFFGSYQRKHRTTDVTDATTGEALRTVNRDDDLGFFKTTWQVTERDRLTGVYFNDPADISGSTVPTTLNNRDRGQKQGGDNYKLEYTHDWDTARLTAYAFKHEGEVSNTAADLSTRNDVAFLNPATTPSIAQRSQGGIGSTLETMRNRSEFGLSGEYWLDTSFGTHAIKSGFSISENEYIEDSRVTGSPDPARYVSIAAANAGVTLAQYTGAGWVGTRSIVAGDVPRFITAINDSPDKAYYLGLLDTDMDGAVTAAELNAYQFSSTTGNPTGQVNNYRIIEAEAAKYSVKATGKTFYLQDTFTMDKWTVNAGVRAEEWVHEDSKGDQSAKFKWEFAPRLSVVYDLAGDGSSKVWGFMGRYYDPLRTNMSDFAGNLTGPVLDEQVFLGDRWLTFRTRGGPKTPDALFAPSTKTPYTDEFMLGWATTLSRDYTLSVSYTKRWTKDILEDYDLGLYSDPTLDPADAATNVGYASPGSKYYLPYSYFGYSAAPNSNYVIGTLAGGKRDYQGIEVSLVKQRSNNWLGSVSYTYNEAKGNSNSDSNADFQGDWVALDPRAPNAYGPQPGNIKHQVKAYGAYYWDNGFEVAGVFNWNSGVLYSRTQLIASRYLPVMDPEYEDGGVYDSWIQANAVGSETGPAYYTLDMRVKYTHNFSFGKAEFFLDINNVLDRQSAISEMPLVAGSGAYQFGEANDWVEPRRFYLGARFSF
jgi:hypothetical protein